MCRKCLEHGDVGVGSTMPALRLLVGTADGLYERGARERRHLNGHEITALAGDGRGWWALVDGGTLWRSPGDGSWEKVADLQDGPGTCLAVTTAGLLVGTAGAHLLHLDGRRLVRVEEFEQVEGRKEWHVHQVLAHPTRAHAVFAAAAVGLGMSDDGGESWRFETQGLHARYLRAVAVAGDHLLVSASTGPGGKRAALYRRRLGESEEFERCGKGLPEWFGSNIDTGCLTASGVTVAFGTDEGLLFVSTDAGASWERLARDLPAIRCVHVAGVAVQQAPQVVAPVAGLGEVSG